MDMKTFAVRTPAWLLMITLAAAPSALAHDYWLESASMADGNASLRLFVGECLKADEEKHYEAGRITRLEAWDSNGSTDLRPSAQDGAQPLLVIPPAATEQLIVFERNASYIELEPKKFDTYLHDEGLEAVRTARRQAGENDKPGRERYLRFLKVLTPGKGDDDAASRTVGQPLELVPMEDPASLTPGERLHVRVMLDGSSLPGAKVELCVRAANGKIKTVSAISDRLGDVAYSIPGTGQALVRTVHMRRITDGDPKADWESLWGSYSFVVRGK